MPYMDGMGIKNGISVSGCKKLNKPSLVLQCLTCVPVIVAGASTKDVEEAMWVGATESNRKMRVALKSLKTPKKEEDLMEWCNCYQTSKMGRVSSFWPCKHVSTHQDKPRLDWQCCSGEQCGGPDWQDSVDFPTVRQIDGTASKR